MLNERTLTQNSFGLAGLSVADTAAINEDYDDFFFGKKARRRRKERKERKKERRSIRFERRRLKNDDRRADTEAKRAQTAVLTATLASTSPGTTQTPSISKPSGTSQVVTQGAAPKASAAEILSNQPNVPLTQKAGFGSNTLVIVMALLIVGGYLVMNNQQETSEGATDLQPA